MDADRSVDRSPDRSANMLGALAVAVVERVERAMLDHPNQTDSSLAALKLVGQLDGCTNAQLSGALQLSHPATVRLLDKLVGAGLVTRAAGADRRAVSLRLTSRGRDRVAAALTARSAVLGELVGRLSDVERAGLDGAVAALLEGLAASPLAAAHVCRLCDESQCDACPVHAAALSASDG